MRSVMQHSFSRNPNVNIPRSSFDRTHGYKTTFDSGYLVPVYRDLVVPGDTFNLRMTAFARLNTPIVPFMDNLFMDSFFFAVPIRLIWENWERMNGAQENPGDSTDYLTPVMAAPVTTGYATGTLQDYLGVPTGVAELEHSALYTRACSLIWNTWFRDENLQDSIVVDTDDGPDDPADYVLQRRGKRYDYFTSCLPWPQKGDAVSLPLGTYAPVVRDPASPYFEVYGNVSGYTGDLGYNSGIVIKNPTGSFSNSDYLYPGDPNGDGTGLRTDLGSATAATINSIREAVTLQQLYEKDARGGTRYIEVIKAHFGVTSPDARLQRPEYLGGGSSPINVNPIAQTSSTDGTTPQGNLAAFATANVAGHGFVKSFTEHCILVGFVSVRADLTYQQGLDRHFSESTRFDYFWPGLAHLGEQPVLNKEIYAQNDANDDLVFGYQERYGHYRYKPSQITGQFRSTYAQSLDIWHLSQEFGSLPSLDSSFIADDPPVDRVVATPDEPHFLFDSIFNLRCARPMPVFSQPGLTRF